ncbi:MAG TPA: chloride channel protein [Tepidisphaeraceae bacterium]
MGETGNDRQPLAAPPGGELPGATAAASRSPAAARIHRDRFGDFTRDRRLLLLSLLALPIGAMGAGIGYALVWLIGAITNVSFYLRWSATFVQPTRDVLGAWVIVVPAIGGLIIGLMARYGSEKIRGHGIPEALEAILIGRSRLNLRVAILKPLSSAVSIGTGGPFGAEGPIIMTGGAFGSLFAQLFSLTSVERKVLLTAGAAAGMAAIFDSPVAAVLISVELLLFEWKPRSFVPVALASATAAALRRPLLGLGPVFPMPMHAPLPNLALVVCVGVGIIAGLASSLLTILVYACEDAFRHLPIHWMWWPTVAGLFVGVIGWIEPRILGVGYDSIREILQGQLVRSALIALLVGKAVAWAVALGSGTSGGVLAPLLIIGGALGALEARAVGLSDPPLWAMISMAAVLGGTMRSPLTSVVFLLELTHDLGVLPELLVACTAAHALTVLLMRRSILTEKLARRGYHLTREYAVDPLAMRRVADTMATDVPSVPSNMSVHELAERIGRGDPWLTHHHAVLVVDDAGQLEAVVTRGDVVRALQVDPTGQMTVARAGTSPPVVAYPDELIYHAVKRMFQHRIGRLPVVSRSNPRQAIGYFGRSNVLASLLDHLREEHEREPAWSPWRRWRRTPETPPTPKQPGEPAPSRE